MQSVKQFFESSYDEGKLFEYDYSQLEIRVLAALSNSKFLLKDLEEGLDMHCMSGSFISGRRYEEFYDAYKKGDPKTVNDRRLAKTVSFQLSYGAHPNTIARELCIPKDAVNRYIANYNARYPEVQEYHQRNLDHLENTKTYFGTNAEGIQVDIGYINLPVGRKVAVKTVFDKWKSKTMFRMQQVQNYPVQGTASDIVDLMYGKLADVLFDEIAEENVMLCVPVHDSFVLDMSPEAIKRGVHISILKLLQETKNIWNSYYGLNFPDLPVSVKCGENWHNMTEFVPS